MVSLQNHWEFLDLLGHQRTGYLLRHKDLWTFPSLQPPLGQRCVSPPGMANWGPQCDTPGRWTHPLWSLRQNTSILTSSVVARAAGMAPVLSDLSRQASRVFAARFLRSLSQPDPCCSRDASQSSVNVLPWLQEENMLSQPCKQLMRYLILRLKEPLEQEVCLTLHFFFLPISHFMFCLLSILLRDRCWGGTRRVGVARENIFIPQVLMKKSVNLKPALDQCRTA